MSKIEYIVIKLNEEFLKENKIKDIKIISLNDIERYSVLEMELSKEVTEKQLELILSLLLFHFNYAIKEDEIVNYGDGSYILHY